MGLCKGKLSRLHVKLFQRMYIYGCNKESFLEGCMSFIGLDACFLKAKYNDQLLIVVGIDRNNVMYPIAYAIIESQNFDTWM